MRELSIFIDESGDWGEYAKHCPYYIVTMVMHDQSNIINFLMGQWELLKEAYFQ